MSPRGVESDRKIKRQLAGLLLLALSLSCLPATAWLLEVPQNEFIAPDETANHATSPGDFNSRFQYNNDPYKPPLHPGYPTSQFLSPLVHLSPSSGTRHQTHALHRPQVRSLSVANSYLNQLLSDAAAAAANSQQQPAATALNSLQSQPSPSVNNANLVDQGAPNTAVQSQAQLQTQTQAAPSEQQQVPQSLSKNNESNWASLPKLLELGGINIQGLADTAQHNKSVAITAAPTATSTPAIDKPDTIETSATTTKQQQQPDSNALSNAAQISSAQSTGQVALQILKPRKGELQKEAIRKQGGWSSSLATAEQSIIQQHALARLSSPSNSHLNVSASQASELSAMKRNPTSSHNHTTFAPKLADSTAPSLVSLADPGALVKASATKQATTSSISHTNRLWPSKTSAAKFFKALVGPPTSASPPANNENGSSVASGHSNGRFGPPASNTARADWSLGTLWTRLLTGGSGVGQTLGGGGEQSRASSLVKAIGDSELSRTLSSVGKTLGSNKYVAGTAAASVLAALGLTMSKFIMSNKMSNRVPFGQADPLATSTSGYYPRYSSAPGSLVTSMDHRAMPQFGEFAQPSLMFGSAMHAPVTLYEPEFEKLPAGGFLYTPLQAQGPNYQPFYNPNTNNINSYNSAGAATTAPANTYVRYVEPSQQEAAQDMSAFLSDGPTSINYQASTSVNLNSNEGNHRQHQRRNVPKLLGSGAQPGLNSEEGELSSMQAAGSDLDGHYAAHYAQLNQQQQQQQQQHQRSTQTLIENNQNNNLSFRRHREQENPRSTSNKNFNNNPHFSTPDLSFDQSFSSSTLNQRATTLDGENSQPSLSNSGWLPSARRLGSISSHAQSERPVSIQSSVQTTNRADPDGDRQVIDFARSLDGGELAPYATFNSKQSGQYQLVAEQPAATRLRKQQQHQQISELQYLPSAVEKKIKKARLESLLVNLPKAPSAHQEAVEALVDPTPNRDKLNRAYLGGLNDSQILNLTKQQQQHLNNNNPPVAMSGSNSWKVFDADSELAATSALAFDGILEKGAASDYVAHLAAKEAWRQIGQNNQDEATTQAAAAAPATTVETTTLMPSLETSDKSTSTTSMRPLAGLSEDYSMHLTSDKPAGIARQARSVGPAKVHHDANNNNGFILVSAKDLAVEVGPSKVALTQSYITNDNTTTRQGAKKTDNATQTVPANEAWAIQFAGAYGTQESQPQLLHQTEVSRSENRKASYGEKQGHEAGRIVVPILKQAATKRLNSTVTAIVHNFDKNCELCRDRLDGLVNELTNTNNTTKSNTNNKYEPRK